MAQFGRGVEGINAAQTVRITSTETVENYTVYVITVTVGQYTWIVKHRYSDFLDIHEKLVEQYKLEKKLLPPKKIFGNLSESFIKKRQKELEIYLQTVLLQLGEVPVCLGEFLDFHRYEIHGITQALAEELFHKGDDILQAGETFHINPLQLFAICSRLQLAEPTCESGDVKKDIGHILDFFTRLKQMKVQGSTELLGTSDIQVNQLAFDMNKFKSLQHLELELCNPEMISDVEGLKKTLKSLKVKHTVKYLKDILLLDVGLWHGEGSALVPAWVAMTIADFSHNSIRAIDESVKLVPRLESLGLSHNELADINHLQHLSALIQLDLSYNQIRHLEALHTKLGNLKCLTVANNKLESLKGFAKLYSLQTLDVSNNEISQVLEVRHIGGLPCLESLILTSNPVTIVLDYRTRILELFGTRAAEVSLDNQKPTQKEVDTVNILLAIQKSKDIRVKGKKAGKKVKVATEVNITDNEGGSQSEPSGQDSSNLPDGDVSAVTKVTDEVVGQNTEGGESDAFRCHVEDIRRQGGPGWLSMYNQLHRTSANLQSVNHEDGTHQEQKQILEVTPEGASAAAATESSAGSSHAKTLPVSVLSSPPEPAYGYSSPNSLSSEEILDNDDQGVILPADLPDANNIDYTDYLKTFIPDTQALQRSSGITHQTESTPRPSYLCWCQMKRYNKPEHSVPVCLLLVRPNLHIFRVESWCGIHTEAPKVSHIYCLPLPNIQQVNLGHWSLSLRIEEAFVGPQGTFTFFKDHLMMREFLKSLQENFRISQSGPYKEEELPLSQAQDLATCVRHCHLSELDITCATNIKLYMIVRSTIVYNLDKASSKLEVRSVILTSNQMFLLKEDYTHTPVPTFAIGPSNIPEFQIVAEIPVKQSMSSCHLYDFNDKSMEQVDVPPGMHLPGSGIKLSFVAEDPNDIKELDLVMYSSEQRDFFLARLTDMRCQKSSPEHVVSTHDAPVTADNLTSGYSHQNTPVIIAESAEGVNNVSQSTSRPVPPTNLNIHEHANQYPTVELLSHLTTCNERLSLQQPLSRHMKNLASMTGEELVNFFHSSIASIGMKTEELYHILWTSVILFTSPGTEIPSCVLLTSKSVYFLSDQAPSGGKIKQWRTHHRNRSDGTHNRNNSAGESHHSSGILAKPDTADLKLLKAYKTIALSDIKQVHIGLFDQRFRLTGRTPDKIISCVVRDSELTGVFIQQLISVLGLVTPSPSPDILTPDTEADFYKMFSAPKRSLSQGMVLGSNVRFLYPNEDIVQDVLCLVASHAREPDTDTSLLMYSCLFLSDSPEEQVQPGKMKCTPRTLVLTNSHVTLLREDHVSYPLPDFMKTLPEYPHYDVDEIRHIESLNSIRVSDFGSHDVTLVFVDEPEELVVDTSVDYYSEQDESSLQIPQVSRTLLLQSLSEKERLVNLISRQWSELHDGKELSIQVGS